MTAVVAGWHPGEVAIQSKLGFADAIADDWTKIEHLMREQHRIFHTSNLPFIPVTTIDERGRPWASIVAGADGEIGFIKSPNASTLVVQAHFWEGDPLLATVRQLQKGREHCEQGGNQNLVAGLGIEFPTRRRNKFAGSLKHIKQMSNLDFELELNVTQALGNCPKYINVRKLEANPATRPSISHHCDQMSDSEKLPQDVVDCILAADTIFMGSVYKGEQTQGQEPLSHAGMNSRGGLPGFVRVSPKDGRTIVIPDYSGNRMMSTLGNIHTSGLCGVSVVSFTTGDVLYLTGHAKILVGASAFEVMPRQACVATLRVDAYTFVRDALPVRQNPSTQAERSPYSPKVKFLRQEAEGQDASSSTSKVRLVKAVRFAEDIAILRFEAVNDAWGGNLNIRPGQAVVLDFMDWIGPPEYHHMANEAPGSINDDRVRTWTVSSAHEGQDTNWFEITMRKMKGGIVTGALFRSFEKLGQSKMCEVSLTEPKVVADVVGVTGDFYLGDEDVQLLLVAGGIGLTPFMAMLDALQKRGAETSADVVLVLVTREPEIFLNLLKTSYARNLRKSKFHIDLFVTKNKETNLNYNLPGTTISVYKGRVPREYWSTVAAGREVFICGPNTLGEAVVEVLGAGGTSQHKIHREGFY